MKNKKKEHTPILYEKYKQTYEKKQHVYTADVPQKGIGKRIGDIVLTAILICMAGLSVTGVITLLNPQMRYLLMEFIGR